MRDFQRLPPEIIVPASDNRRLLKYKFHKIPSASTVVTTISIRHFTKSSEIIAIVRG